jgi:hypothetical protein
VSQVVGQSVSLTFLRLLLSHQSRQVVGQSVSLTFLRLLLSHQSRQVVGFLFLSTSSVSS